MCSNKRKEINFLQFAAIFLFVILLTMNFNVKTHASFINIPGNFVLLYPGEEGEIVSDEEPEKGTKITVSTSNSKIVKLIDKSFPICIKGVKTGNATITIKQRIKKKTKVTKIKVLVSKYIQYQLSSDTDSEGNSVPPYPKIKVKNNTVIFSGAVECYNPANEKVKKLKSKTRKFKFAKNAYVGGAAIAYSGYLVKSKQGKNWLKKYKKGWILDGALVHVAVEKNRVIYLYNYLA